VFQLPRHQHYVVGLRLVFSVLRLAAAKLSTALRSAETQQATLTRSTSEHSEVRASTKDDAQSVSSAVSHTNNSSECHFHWPRFCFWLGKTVDQVSTLLCEPLKISGNCRFLLICLLTAVFSSKLTFRVFTINCLDVAYIDQLIYRFLCLFCV